QAGACTALAAVKLQAQQADGVNTETDSALGEAGFEGADEAQAPFFSLAVVVATRAVTPVAVEVYAAGQNVQAAVFDKAIGLGLRAGECQLAGARGYCQGDYAPLHHLHRDCSLGLEELRCPLFCYMGGSFFLCRR